MNARVVRILLALVLALCPFLQGCGPQKAPAASKTVPAEALSEAHTPGDRAETSTTPAAPARTAPAGELSVHIIDVGQGDSILVRLPSGKTLLIDAGEASQGEAVVNYLRSQGVKTIDYLVATHPHSDHIGGMTAVLDAYPVGDVFMPRTGHTTTTYERFLLKLRKKGLKATEAKTAVQMFEEPGLSAAFVAPCGNRHDDLNDWSAVLRLQYGNTVFLFTGDAEAVSEAEMLRSPAFLKADVLKVGHHGSNRSTTSQFLKAVAPRYAVVSVGRENSFGHPHRETLGRLADAKVEVYRTDFNGTVVFTSDGQSIAVRLGKPGGPSTTAGPPASVTSKQASSRSDEKAVMVYITKTGKKYHRDGCRYLTGSKSPLSLEEAKSKGYLPCSACKPPQ